jgi:beta-glucanase (GH16 family)
MNITKRKILLAVLIVILITSVAYLVFKAKEFYQGTSKTYTIVGTGAATTTAQINSNNFNTLGQTFPTTTSPSTTQNSSNSDLTTAGLLKNMTRTFDDEFNTFNRYTDVSGNVTCSSGGVGTWQTVYYFCSRTNPGNAEAEVYTDPSFWAYLKSEPLSTAETDSDNPFSISDGVLSIKAAPASQQVTSAVGSWAQYTSGMITTQYSFSQKYGYFEMRAELPVGKGLWPAFWLLPTSQAWPPEIDALEAFGDPNPSGDGGNTMIHYGSHSLQSAENCGGWYNVNTNITTGFHTYGVNIEPSGITYYFDGNAYATCPANSEANQPFYMIINLAIGSSASWPGAPDASTPWPATLKVDYVRAYQTN